MITTALWWAWTGETLVDVVNEEWFNVGDWSTAMGAVINMIEDVGVIKEFMEVKCGVATV